MQSKCNLFHILNISGQIPSLTLSNTSIEQQKFLKSKNRISKRFSRNFSILFNIRTPTALQHNAPLIKRRLPIHRGITHHYCNSARTYSRYGISLSQAIYIATLFAQVTVMHGRTNRLKSEGSCRAVAECVCAASAPRKESKGDKYAGIQARVNHRGTSFPFVQPVRCNLNI